MTANQTPSAPTRHDETATQRRYPATPLVGAAAAVFRATSVCATEIVETQGSKTAEDGTTTGRAAQKPPGEVLLVKRKYPPRAGEWGLPGGRLRLGEHSAAGALRELAEECNINAHIGGVIDTFEPIVYDPHGRIEYHYVVIEYWANYTGGEPQPGDDAAAVRWFPMHRLAESSLRPDAEQIVQKAYRAWQEWMAHGTQDRA